MAMFHSYVKLPEGNSIKSVNRNPFRKMGHSHIRIYIYLYLYLLIISEFSVDIASGKKTCGDDRCTPKWIRYINRVIVLKTSRKNTHMENVRFTLPVMIIHNMSK